MFVFIGRWLVAIVPILAVLITPPTYDLYNELRVEYFGDPQARCPAEAAAEAWSAVRDSTSDADFSAFIVRFPACPQVAAAELRISQIQRVPKDLVVDATGGGDYSSLAAALAAAPEGATVRVAPGIYREQLRVDRAVHVTGGGAKPEDVQIIAQGAACVVWRAAQGSLSNLALRLEGVGGQGCVQVQRGAPTLERLRVTGGTAPALTIAAGATPVLRESVLRDSAVGVRLGAGSAVLQGNEIVDNRGAGIEAASQAAPLVTENRVAGNGGSGLLLLEGALGRYEDNELSGNGLSGVSARGGAVPELLRNRIHDNRQSGVLAAGAMGRIEGNDIFTNRLNGIELTAAADPLVRENRIHGNGQSGAFVYKGGQGRFEANALFANAMHGLSAREGGRPAATDNQIHDNGESGVFAYEGGIVRLERNTIRGNGMNGVSAKERGELRLVRANVIENNGAHGVVVSDGGMGTLQDNEIRANARTGVEVTGNASLVLTENRVTGNAQGGIAVHSGARARIERNEIFGNAQDGLRVGPEGHAVASANTILDNRGAGIYLYEGGLGRIDENHIDNNRWGIYQDGAGKDGTAGSAASTAAIGRNYLLHNGQDRFPVVAR